MKNRICILSLLLMIAMALPARAQMVAIKTNALNWAACTPDLGVEFITGEHTSVALSVYGHYKPYGVWDSKIFGLQPEFRYWFSGRPLTREFVGAAGNFVMYDTVFGRNVYQGNALSLGVTGGYVFSLGKRWGVELSAGVGILVFRQKQYAVGDNYDDYIAQEATRVNNWGYKLFPVKLNASFFYIIK